MLKRPHLAKKRILFHQDNAIVHTHFVANAKFHYTSFFRIHIIRQIWHLANISYFQI